MVAMLPIARRWFCLAPAALLTAESRREEMDRRIRAAIAGFSGDVYLCARNLDTGESYGIRENERVRTASTIKLPIMTAVFAAVEAGRARWDETLTLEGPAKVNGSGVIREFSNGLRLPIQDLVHVMIVVSDNTATNMILDRFPGDLVNSEMDKLGLKQTRSLRKIMGDSPALAGVSAAGRIPENRRFGIGVTTPAEMVSLLEKLVRGEVVSPAASREMIEVLKRQQYKDGIGRNLEKAEVASKSGALDHLRSDVGIVYTTSGRLAIAATVDEMSQVDYSRDNPGNILISQLTHFLRDGMLGR